MARPKAPPKPPTQHRKAARKDEMVPVRMTSEQKQILMETARDAGLGLSTWLLTLGLKETKKR